MLGRGYNGCCYWRVLVRGELRLGAGEREERVAGDDRVWTSERSKGIRGKVCGRFSLRKAEGRREGFEKGKRE